MRINFFIIFIVYSFCSYSQTVVQGRVKDAKTKEPLPYCSISVKNSGKGSLTNPEGVFNISVYLKKDTLLFSYMGYIPFVISADKLYQDKEVYLQRKEVLLQKVTIHADNDFLYTILERCRMKLVSDQTNRVSKVYYGEETATREQPVELVECYYNGYMKGTAIEELRFKNGRIGLAELDNRYFLTLNSSKAISIIELTKKSDYSPANPFQFRTREMKKYFSLELGDSDDKIYQIKFQPCHGQNKCFSGEIWLYKTTLALLKIDLTIENTAKHPFLPLFAKDSLYNVGLTISRTYKQDGSDILLDHINFSYHFTYKSVRDSVTATTPSVLTRDISTKGVMYFYDYEDPFILPYFEYDASYDDYRKMSIIPYNDLFWNNNNTLLLTEKQKEDLGFFSNEGSLINFKEGNYGKNFLTKISSYLQKDTSYHSFYEYYYTFWSPEERIILNRQLRQNEMYSPEKINQSIPSDLYNLKVQILLDVTQLADSLCCKSYTVFDANKTFYHLPEYPCTNAFLNIYFDICEIERRKMEKEISSCLHSVSLIDSIFNKTRIRIDNITQIYLKEVQLGKNGKELLKWNDYVMKNLNIDNLSIFQNSGKGQN